MPMFPMTEYRSSLCESCHSSELLLIDVKFPDGEVFKVCSRCADEAHRLCLEVFGR